MQAEARKRTSEPSPAGAGTQANQGDGPSAGRSIGGRYRLERALDWHARVWRALDETGARCVLKTGPAELIDHEHVMLAALDHPHVVRLAECIETEGRLWLVLEYLSGGDLVSLAGFEPGAWLGPIREVVDALGFVHDRGIVHRDLKARNVMLDAAGRARLIDFGSALPAGQAWSPGGTTEGAVAPGRGEAPVGAADDVYALACLVHEMLHGTLPAAGREKRALDRAWQPLSALVESVLGPAGAGTGRKADLESFRTVIKLVTENQREGQ